VGSERLQKINEFILAAKQALPQGRQPGPVTPPSGFSCLSRHSAARHGEMHQSGEIHPWQKNQQYTGHIWDVRQRKT